MSNLLNKIKCSFGYHRWKYWESIARIVGDRNSPDIPIHHRQCEQCNRHQQKIKGRMYSFKNVRGMNWRDHP